MDICPKMSFSPVIPFPTLQNPTDVLQDVHQYKAAFTVITTTWFMPFWGDNPDSTFRDILGKQRAIQPVHANEGQRIHPVRIYRMDKHYIPGKLSFFIHLYIYICFHLSLTPSCVNNKQFSVLSRKVTICVQCLTLTHFQNKQAIK